VRIRTDRREVSPLRKPTRSQEANARKKRRLAPVEMTSAAWVAEFEILSAADAWSG
jgi:hypothetical protein